MPTFDRTTIVRGPCKITYDGATFYTKGGVSITVANETFDKDTDAYGMAGKAKTGTLITVEFTPVGEIEALTVLYPFGSTAMGASIYGATDKPLVIVSADATYTVLNAAVTTLPGISLSATKTAFGSVQFIGLLSKDGDPADFDDYMTIGAGASIGVAFDPSKIITAPYTATLGAIGPFFSEQGFEISFDLALSDVPVDGIGIVDKVLTNLGCSISMIPTGISSTAFDTFFDALDAGEDLASSALDISTATVGGLNFDCAAVQVLDLQRRFSPSDQRLGTLNLAAKRTFSAGVPAALFTIAATA